MQPLTAGPSMDPQETLYIIYLSSTTVKLYGLPGSKLVQECGRNINNASLMMLAVLVELRIEGSI